MDGGLSITPIGTEAREPSAVQLARTGLANFMRGYTPS